VRRALVLVCALAITTLACGGLFTTTPTPLPTLTAIPPTSAPPTATRVPTPVGTVPSWWASELKMPQGAEFAGIVRDNPTWSTRDVNADELRDTFVRQATSAGYATTVITKSQSAIYDVLMLKGQTAFALNITLGSDRTILTGSRIGIFHLKVSGGANIELDLPMRERVNLSPGSEVSIGTSIPSAQCRGCEFFINVHIAPFRGPGTYDSKPGLSIIDLQVIPGSDPFKEDFRWAQSCVVIVRDANSGTFDCRGLQNVYDQTRKIDVSGSWQ
jgi:hypothetical protein